MLNGDKYRRSVELTCPTCGGKQFEVETPSADSELVKCHRCNREITKDELIEFNSENVSRHVEEIGKKIVNDLTTELKRAFSGSTNFKIR
jgi:uncharacterized Zn finger protein